MFFLHLDEQNQKTVPSFFTSILPEPFATGLSQKLQGFTKRLICQAAGRPGRFLRLLVGGAFIGFIWELYNIEARAKWIYTVPGFEDFKLFEMPLLGFVGFPVLALDCFVVYQSLVLAGVAVPPELGLNRRIPPRRVLGAAVAAVIFSLVALVGMDRWNTDSTVPRLDDLWLAEPAAIERLAAARYDDLFQ